MGYLKQTKISVSFCKKISYRGKCVICVQFGQNFNTLYHMTWLHFFETWQYNGQKIVVFANFPKKSPFQEKEEFGPNSVQNYSILYLMICHRVFLKHFGMMRHDRLKKVVLIIFPEKSSFNKILQCGPNMGQKYATLCPKQLYLMIHSLKLFK